MLDITLGNHGLDVGCGNGDDVSALAGIVDKMDLLLTVIVVRNWVVVRR